MDFHCPNCDSKNYIAKHSLGKKINNGPYKNVLSEIQCSECFADIPSILSENINKNEINKIKNLWQKEYKPEHLKHAARCSKCYRVYWEIEKKLFNKKISRKDIFYQIYNPHNGISDLICKLCDPNSFK